MQFFTSLHPFLDGRLQHLDLTVSWFHLEEDLCVAESFGIFLEWQGG